jgi:hypothetical protein
MAFHHVIADGKSGTALLLEVLRRAAGEDIAMQLQAAHPHAQDLDPITRAGALAGAVKRLRFWMGQGKSALLMPQQLPGYDTRLRPARTIKAIPYTLPPEDRRGTAAACRVHATTVHGALGAAQILAINSEFDAPAARPPGSELAGRPAGCTGRQSGFRRPWLVHCYAHYGAFRGSRARLLASSPRHQGATHPGHGAW